jgi:hypothetical protein
MTKQEFYDDITEWPELREIAQDADYHDSFEDIVDSEYVGQEVKARAENTRDDDWEAFASWVEDIPRGYEYYRYDDYDETYESLTETDFESEKNALAEWMERNGHFDAEEPAEEEEPEWCSGDPCAITELLGITAAAKSI